MSPFGKTNSRKEGTMSLLPRARAWFTPARRIALYAVALAVLPLLSRSGVIADTSVEPWLILVQAALQVTAGVLMLSNLSFADAATWFQRNGRAAIYAFGGFVAPALTALGFITPVGAEYWLQLLSDLLAIAAALLAALYITPSSPPPIIPGVSLRSDLNPDE